MPQKLLSDMTTPQPAYIAELLRHFADLRDGTHGDATSRRDKEQLFTEAVSLLDPYARQALNEINAHLLLGTGKVTVTGVRTSASGGVDAVWALSWPEQRATGINPIVIDAFYGSGFHHPHLRGGTLGDWPLNSSPGSRPPTSFPRCAPSPLPTCTTWSSNATTGSFPRR